MAALTPVAVYTPTTDTTLASTAKDQTQRTLTKIVAAGQIIVIKYAIPDSGGVTVGLPTDTQGLTWTQRAIASEGSTSTPIAILWTSSPASAGSITITTAAPTAGRWQRAVVEVWPTGTTIGAVVQVTPTLTDGLPTATLTTTGTDSAVSTLIADYQGRTATPAYTGTVTSEYVEQSSSIGSHYQFHKAAPTAGSQTVGMSSPTAQRWGLVAAEMKQAGGTNLTANLADNVPITDTGTPITFDVGDLTADPVATTDAADDQQANVRTAGDSVAATDQTAATQATTRTAADPVGATDTAASSAAVDRSAADPVALSDTITVTWNRQATVSDTVAATDATNVDQTGTGTQTVSDNTPISDVVTVTLARLVNLVDPIGATDVPATAATVVANPADALGVSDTVTAQLDRVVTVADLLALTDNTVTAGDTVRTATAADTAAITDQTTSDTDSRRTTADTIGLADNVVAQYTGADDGTAVDQPRLAITTTQPTLTITTVQPTLHLTGRP